MDYPKLGTPIFLGLVAILCLVISWRNEDWPEGIRLLLGLVGLFLMVCALLTGVNVITYESNERLMEYRRAMAISERVAMLEKIRQMKPEQIAAMDRYVPTVELLAGDAGPITWLRLPTANVPMQFVEEFLERGDEEFLGTIRGYPEGSKEREWAERFTEYAVWNGWAAPAAGNRPARWVDRQRCWRAIGIEDL